MQALISKTGSNMTVVWVRTSASVVCKGGYAFNNQFAPMGLIKGMIGL